MENQRETYPQPRSGQYVFGRPWADSPFLRGDAFFEPDLVTRIGPVYTPSFDLIETPEKYTLVGDLPGLGLRDLDIDLTATTLTVAGEREPEPLGSGTSCHALERSFGSFLRIFQVPARGTGECLARMRNGVLRVDVPKRSEAPAGPEAPWH
jgi:HSP20 family protein